MHDPRFRDDFLRTPIAMLSLLAMAFLAIYAPAASGESSSRLTPIVRAVRDCSPAVVDIQGQKSVEDTSHGSSGSRQVNGMGTGVVIDPRCYILTNHHVVDGVRRIKVSLDGGRTYIAKLVAHDRETDLAVIYISTPSPLPVVKLGSSHDLMVGETVFAVGNAFGYQHSVTRGIISALHRNVQVNETQQYLDLIQTDASINPGNSGGPLLNIDGEMIGINVAVRAGAQGIGFAIPLNKALDVAAGLMSIEKLDNHWHGMTAMAMDGPAGPITISRVDRNSPAQLGGLERGDLLEQIGGTKIRRPIDVECALLGRSTGESVEVIVTRDDEQVELKLTMASRSSVPTPQVTTVSDSSSIEAATWKTLGLRLEQVSRSEFRKLDLPYDGGMRVVAVRPGCSAAKKGVLKGDILVRMHRWTIVSKKDISFVVDHADALAGSGEVEFYIVRGDKPYIGHLEVASNRSGKSQR